VNRYQFTNAAGNRLVELCLKFNREMTLGEVPYCEVDQYLRKEGYRGEFAVREFVQWLKVNAQSSSSAAKVLGLVALGMATEMARDREFIDKVATFHTAMNRRFGVDEGDVVKGGE
jgi:hypothetical protein